MNNSSQEQTYTITLDEQIDFSGLTTTSIPTIGDISTVQIPALTSADIITLTGTPYSGAAYGTTISNIETIDIGSFTGYFKEEFNGRFPDYDRVQEMCKEYPGLEIAYRKFKEVYKMVKEDYDGKERVRRGKY